MTKRMLIDASHAEETRVVVLDGNRLEDFDVETATKRQLKGNIYLAKVVRVEPSLQAAFVEYGGNRHGFLAFGEIHPDYYQIPVADRQRLMEAQEAEAREDEAAEEAFARGDAPTIDAVAEEDAVLPAAEDEVPNADGPYVPPEPAEHGTSEDDAASAAELVPPTADGEGPEHHASSEDGAPSAAELMADVPAEGSVQALAIADEQVSAPLQGDADAGSDMTSADESIAHEPDSLPIPDESFEAPEESPGEPAAPPPESLGGETEPRERRAPRFLRNYKIQEVIRRRQILLIQVVKEERGGKGAALTTYISLAGRYSVLMPNSPRGGGISRKITSAADRRRLKEVTSELALPRGMGMIVRTAGAARPKAEILRDGEYLLNQWDQIRELTMKSVAPALIYEEANLIKRTIRDVYSRDIDEIHVDGEAGWRHARDFMRMLMPAHARKVQLWREGQPLFAKMQVEAQLDSMLQPTVQLRSGGYLVINQTEALVAIDVNSGRSTRERGIEETALRTNMEAATEVARQLRLRDLAGLIVIDFIDMEQRRHNAMVERELKDSLRFDRARIQVGSISHFGLMEMSRQRLRPSLAETSFVACPQCGGTGHVRGTENAALYVLRAVEEEGAKRRAAEIVVHVAGAIALYVLNHKRARLGEIEARYGMTVAFAADESLRPPEVRIERLRAQTVSELPAPVSQGGQPDPRYAAIDAADAMAEEAPDEADEMEDEADGPAGSVTSVSAPAGSDPSATGTAAAGSDAGRRRRRRRRGGRRDDAPGALPGAEGEEAEGEESGDESAEMMADSQGADAPVAEETVAAGAVPEDATAPMAAEAGEGAEAKRRGRRGGRRRRRDPAVEAGADALPEPNADDAAMEPVIALVPAWTGPTPADPFGKRELDIFDVMEMAEAQRLEASAQRVTAEVAGPSDTADGGTPAHDPAAVALAESEPATSEPAPSGPATSEPAMPEDGAMQPGLAAPVIPDPIMTEEPVGQSSLPDLEPALTPPAPSPDLPVEDPLPWTTPEVLPSEDPAVEPIAEPPAPPKSEAETHPADEREPELALAPAEEPIPAAEKRRGWWRR